MVLGSLLNTLFQVSVMEYGDSWGGLEKLVSGSLRGSELPGYLYR